jgi:hypothetical protein
MRSAEPTREPSPWPAILIFAGCGALAIAIHFLRLPGPWSYLRLIPLYIGIVVVQKRFGTSVMLIAFASYWVIAFFVGFLASFLK